MLLRTGSVNVEKQGPFHSLSRASHENQQPASHGVVRVNEIPEIYVTVLVVLFRKNAFLIVVKAVLLSKGGDANPDHIKVHSAFMLPHHIYLINPRRLVV